jgi:dCTP deaminase
LDYYDKGGVKMSVMPDHWIAKMARECGMIEPFVDRQIRDGISYGLSSYGYDFRIADEFKVFCKVGAHLVVDPKSLAGSIFEDFKGDVLEIPPLGLALGRSVEYFRIPREVVTICFGKSTYARCGVYIHVTPFEPEWEGYATVAISNAAPYPVKVYAGEGIGQILFLKADSPCEISYRDKGGKYQRQLGITTAKV